jgi:hypothetical protein
MKKATTFLVNKLLLTLILISYTQITTAQKDSTAVKPKSEFWKKVSFIPSLGLGFGSGYTNISVAPAAVYKVNKYFSTGLGIQYSYLKQKNLFSSSTYGGSLIALSNPIDEIQLSAELEQLKANVKNEVVDKSESFWNTAFFVGAGYRLGNSVIGARYNLLFKKDKGVYGDAFTPFIRISF